MAVLTDARCTGCGACLLTCPTHAIRPVGGRLHTRDELCTGCAECVEICPADAIMLFDPKEDE
jgi:electron transport complex protein RnfB